MDDYSICRECQKILVELQTSISHIVDRMEANEKLLGKIVFALLGIIGATIGVKFIGTPWYVEVAIYSALISAIFMTGVTVWRFRYLSKGRIIIRLSYAMLVVHATGVRIYYYAKELPIPMEAGVAQNMLFVCLAIALAIDAWHE